MQSGKSPLRVITSIAVVGSLACAVWATGLPRMAEGSTTRTSVTNIVATSPATVETDAQRRQRLNDRLAEMVRNGGGSRLTDAPPRRQVRRVAQLPATPAGTASLIPSPRTVVSTAEKAAAVVVASSSAFGRDDVSTISPPAYRGGPVRSTGRGYKAPRLDLITPPQMPVSDIECLTQALYYEARNESEDGQAAVAEVIINRSRAGNYPRRICDVVYQRNSRTCQFTFTCDGSIGRSPVQMRAWGRAERIGRDVLEGRAKAQLPRTSVNYHANYVSPTWGRRLERVRQIGAHIFYGSALKGSSTPGSSAGATEQVQSGGLQFVRIEALDRAYTNLTYTPPTAAAP